MVKIPEQSGQYLLSLVAVGRQGRDWDGGLWFVTSRSIGKGGGHLQGVCPVGIRYGYRVGWKGWGECGRCGEGVETVLQSF